MDIYISRICVCVRRVSFRLAYTTTESIIHTTKWYVISILWDTLMIVASSTEICWWLAICNKIRVTKEYSLVYFILKVFKVCLRISGIFIYFYSHCKYKNNLFKIFCISEMYLLVLTTVHCTFSTNICKSIFK